MADSAVKRRRDELSSPVGNPLDHVAYTKPRNPQGKLRDTQDLGELIRKRRKELGLTQQDLADQCQCSRRFIGDLERGTAGGNIEQVIRVCTDLGMDLFLRVRGR
jgi:HTH-type transcriptional regulator/antitoxin HipB